MDDDIYAYEHEMDEMDEWEAMHAHEMEAADEAMRAMEAPTTTTPSSKRAFLSADVDMTQPPPPQQGSAATNMHASISDEVSAIDAKIARAQERLNNVLNRCATLMDDDNGDTSTLQEAAAAAPTTNSDARAARVTNYVQKQTKATATTAAAAAAAVDATTASFLHSRPPADVDSLSVVLSDGRRMFLRKKLPLTNNTRITTATTTANPLALMPISEMMANIERRQIEATLAATDAVPLDADDAVGAMPDHPQPPRSTVLWLDKYKPKRFIDLLSDERTNREVLLWLKSWDKFVFPKKKAPLATSSLAAAATSRSDAFAANAQGLKPPSVRFGDTPGAHADNTEVDNDARPFQKLILICGPPGAGKTTLANIVARHAGYNPIEVNASDDRTAAVLKNKIISAMEMQSIFGSQKPNCIILDEIDGAMNGGDGKSAIAAIQEIVLAPLKRSSTKSTRRSSSGSNHHPLTRPLICICNDQFASVLRPLRQLATIFVLAPPQVQRLVSRLKFICKAERLTQSTGSLSALATRGGNDIRFCLNALQVQSASGASSASSASSSSSSSLVGEKDQQSGVHDALEKVFYQPKARLSRQATTTSSGSLGQSSAIPQTAAAMPHQSIASEIEDAVHSMGNYALLLQGLDENVPTMLTHDATLEKMVATFEWLALGDAWDTAARRDQQFALQAFVPFAALAVHTACVTSTRRRVVYPKAQFVATQRTEKAVNILTALSDGAAPQHLTIRQSARILAVDVISSLVAVLAPPIRHVNPSLQSLDEKAMLARVTELMLSLGLSFRRIVAADGFEDYTLEPPLQELLTFRSNSNNGSLHGLERSLLAPPPSSSTQWTLPLAVRKLLAREAELQQLRRTNESSKNKRRVLPADAEAIDDAAAASIPHAPVAPAFVIPELSDAKRLEKLEAVRKRNPFAFAHREAKRKRDADERQLADASAQQRRGAYETSTNEGERGDDSAVRPVVRYKFNEGYTCGIITTVAMRDLL